jgi:hypothetical protein
MDRVEGDRSRPFPEKGIDAPESVGNRGPDAPSIMGGGSACRKLGNPSGGKSRQAIAARRARLIRRFHGRIEETMPDPLPKPPGRPPAEPIIIKRPPRPAQAPEVDRSPDEEDDPEIRMPPEIIPEMPPPPGPGEQAA